MFFWEGRPAKSDSFYFPIFCSTPYLEVFDTFVSVPSYTYEWQISLNKTFVPSS